MIAHGTAHSYLLPCENYTVAKMKICKNCKHCVPDPSFIFIFSQNKWQYAKCAKTKEVAPAKPDILDGSMGKEIVRMDYCSVERVGWQSDDCGPEGKHYEPK